MVNLSAAERLIEVMSPAVVTPIVAWLFSFRADARRSSELEAVLRRLELVERLQKVYGAGESRAPYRDVLDAELRGILADLGELRVPEVPAHVLARRAEGLPAGAIGSSPTNRRASRERSTKPVLHLCGVWGARWYCGGKGVMERGTSSARILSCHWTYIQSCCSEGLPEEVCEGTCATANHGHGSLGSSHKGRAWPQT